MIIKREFCPVIHSYDAETLKTCEIEECFSNYPVVENLDRIVFEKREREKEREETCLIGERYELYHSLDVHLKTIEALEMKNTFYTYDDRCESIK